MQHIGPIAAEVVAKAGAARRGVERIPITDRESWLAMRRQDVTASSAGALLGCHEYITAYALWAEKTGQVAVDGEMTEAMERGIELEPLALRRLAKQRADWKVWNPQVYLREPEHRLGATPDAFVECPERGFGVVQIKSVEPMVFRRKWRADDGSIEPPLWIALQAMIESELAGAKWAAVAALVISHGIELHVVEVPLDARDRLVGRIRQEIRSFWQMIADGYRPDPDWKRDGRLIEALYTPDGETVDLSDDNALPALCDEKDRLASEKSATDRRLKEIKAEMLAKLNGASAARIADGRMITAKEVHRKGYEVGPTRYVDVRIRKSEGAAA